MGATVRVSNTQGTADSPIRSLVLFVFSTLLGFFIYCICTLVRLLSPHSPFLCRKADKKSNSGCGFITQILITITSARPTTSTLRLRAVSHPEKSASLGGGLGWVASGVSAASIGCDVESTSLVWKKEEASCLRILPQGDICHVNEYKPPNATLSI